jgi:hypothetical protein
MLFPFVTSNGALSFSNAFKSLLLSLLVPWLDKLLSFEVFYSFWASFCGFLSFKKLGNFVQVGSLENHNYYIKLNLGSLIFEKSVWCLSVTVAIGLTVSSSWEPFRWICWLSFEKSLMFFYSWMLNIGLTSVTCIAAEYFEMAWNWLPSGTAKKCQSSFSSSKG